MRLEALVKRESGPAYAKSVSMSRPCKTIVAGVAAINPASRNDRTIEDGDVAGRRRELAATNPASRYDGMIAEGDVAGRKREPPTRTA